MTCDVKEGVLLSTAAEVPLQSLFASLAKANDQLGVHQACLIDDELPVDLTHSQTNLLCQLASGLPCGSLTSETRAEQFELLVKGQSRDGVQRLD